MFVLFASLLAGTITNKTSQRVCFDGGLGCYDNEGPFETAQRPITALPEAPEIINTKFKLYSRSAPSEFTFLDYNDEDGLRQSSFNGDFETKIIIHGYRSDTIKPWMIRLVEELHKQDNYNVISVDWKNGSFSIYPTACSNARVVGVQISLLIKALSKLSNKSDLKFHLIGHSLGAQVAGYAGEKVHVDRITALDPNGPYFESTDPAVRLDTTDADFVDAIHTDSGLTLDFGLGMRQAIGHVDFYPNGGAFQPGCPSNKFPSTIIGGITGWLNNETLDKNIKETFLCSHKRSEFLFVESVNTPCSFTSYPCKSAKDLHSGKCIHTNEATGRMGFHANKALGRGKHMLETFPKAPFCAYHYQVDISGRSTINGVIYLTLHGTKGKSDQMDITGHNKLLTPGEHFITSMMIRVDIGDLVSIELKYLETKSLIGFLFDDEWKLESMTIFGGATQKMSHFCLKDEIAVSGQQQSFDAKSEC